MFGEHDRDKAEAIAKEKEIELGRKCIVVPGIEDPKKFTVGVAITETTTQNFIDNLRKYRKL